jgi:cytochrome c5
MRYILIAAATLLLTFCKTTSTGTSAAYEPTADQVTEASTRWPGTTAILLKEGHNIYVTKCNECHKTFAVVKFSEKKWLHEIDDMAPRAKLTAVEKEQLTRYILSKRATEKSSPS